MASALLVTISQNVTAPKQQDSDERDNGIAAAEHTGSDDQRLLRLLGKRLANGLIQKNVLRNTRLTGCRFRRAHSLGL